MGFIQGITIKPVTVLTAMASSTDRPDQLALIKVLSAFASEYVSARDLPTTQKGNQHASQSASHQLFDRVQALLQAMGDQAGQCPGIPFAQVALKQEHGDNHGSDADSAGHAKAVPAQSHSGVDRDDQPRSQAGCANQLNSHRCRVQGSAHGIRYLVDKHFEELGLKAEGISCHALRDSATIWARARGARLDAIAGMLGHTSVTTTGVYAKTGDKIAENPARYLEELIGFS